MSKASKKLDARTRRKFRIRSKLAGSAERPRVSVFRSDKYTYAQVVSDSDGRTLLSASTRDADVRERVKSLPIGDQKSEGSAPSRSTKSVLSARGLGIVLAEKCAAKGIGQVVFDRNGFLYHGRIKALADGLREGGLKV